MKIVVINGQNHKGSTWNIGHMLVDKIKGQNEVEEFFLPRDLNHFCIGCFTCIKDMEKCPYYADKKVIADAMDKAELIVVTSPNYCMLPSAPMKAFLDLFFQYWIPHRPRASMFKKKVVVISTTAGMGADKVCKQLKTNFTYWGVPYIKKYAAVVQASSWSEVSSKRKAKIEKDITKLANKIQKAKVGKPSLYIRIMFNMMALVKSNPEDIEGKYWKEQGWLDRIRPWKY